MKRVLLIIFILTLVIPPAVQAQEEQDAVILSPQPGQVVQGVVVISGTVVVLGFSSYELAFAYDGDPTGTWFELNTGSLPVEEGELGVWDTTTLTDGDYAVRLRVNMLDGSIRDIAANGVRVRNYTSLPTPTVTFTATAMAGMMIPTPQVAQHLPATATPMLPTPTNMPANPAMVSVSTIAVSIGQGALWILILFIVFGLFIRLRRE